MIVRKMHFFFDRNSSDRKIAFGMRVVTSHAWRKRENCFARKRARKKSLRLRMYKGGISRLTVLCEQTIRTPETVRTQQSHPVRCDEFLLLTRATYARGNSNVYYNSIGCKLKLHS